MKYNFWCKKIDVCDEFDENVKNKIIDLNKRENFDVIDLIAIIVHVILNDVIDEIENVIEIDAKWNENDLIDNIIETNLNDDVSNAINVFNLFAW